MKVLLLLTLTWFYCLTIYRDMLALSNVKWINIVDFRFWTGSEFRKLINSVIRHPVYFFYFTFPFVALCMFAIPP